jgi:hypothetical protein
MSDLAPDIVELAPWIPPATDAAPLREVGFRLNAWLPEEVDPLRRMFAAGEPVEQIARAIGRGVAGVQDKIWRLGMRRSSALPWTELQDAELVRRYGREAAATIAQDLGRTVASIYVRAQLLELTETGRPPWTGWEIAQLRAGYDRALSVAQIADLIGRRHAATNTKAHELGLRHPNHPDGWSEAEIGRALELAAEGHRYAAIMKRMAEEGFPRRTKAGFGPAIRKMGYARGWGRAWTPEEDDLLRRAYHDGASLTPLRTRLGRKRESIACRAQLLGLQGTHAIKAGWRTKPVWTDEDEARLRAGYGKVPTRQLARELGRPLPAIYTRANHLGLKHPWMRAFTDEDAKLVQIAWKHGVALQDIADAIGRDQTVVSKFAVRQGYSFSDPARPTAPKAGGAKKLHRLSRAEILALAGPGETFEPLRRKARRRPVRRQEAAITQEAAA